jgi:hypothetical protein
MINDVYPYDYHFSLRRQEWLGPLFSGLTPHEELEGAIKEDKLPEISCVDYLGEYI